MYGMNKQGTSLGVAIQWEGSTRTFRLWEQYAAFVEQTYGIPANIQRVVGDIGEPVLDANYDLMENMVYTHDILFAIRNLSYGLSMGEQRLEILGKFDLAEPILDYGAGVGTLGIVLHQLRGCKNVWCHEPPGIMRDIMVGYLVPMGINIGVPDKPGTVICMNVLEHVEKPMEMLEYLRGLGGRLLANCDTEDNTGHIAPKEERMKVLRSLRERDELYGAGYYKYGVE